MTGPKPVGTIVAGIGISIGTLAASIGLIYLMAYEPPTRVPLGIVKTVEHTEPAFSWPQLKTLPARTHLCIDDQCIKVRGRFKVLPG
ncbi:hypothetical protein, partial [Mesorhizobium sp. M7A.T.Ca.US.000.02.1.1]|uniref:hypothetical protein n=1 Tax=Mesorhizobium sp. M7A.T.Ca.US.000.02.1.1 TaxID=2496792 RepID=UPI0019D4A444